MSSRHLQELGLTLVWSAGDREACLEHHRDFYERLKARYGGVTTPAHKIPGLLAAVEDLLNDGYSLTDVSVMFGVSRERVRQWTDGLGTGVGRGACYRVWDDE